MRGCVGVRITSALRSGRGAALANEYLWSCHIAHGYARLPDVRGVKAMRFNAALRRVSGHMAGTFVFVDGSGRIRGWQWR